MSDTRQRLELLGLTLAAVPAGDYPVGAERDQLLARPPGVARVPPQAVRPQTVTTDGFLITTEPLRLSHWRRLADTRVLSILSEAEAAAVAAQASTAAAVLVAPSAGSVQGGASSAAQWQPQQPEPDPVLSVTPDQAARIAELLGAALPRWDEWEIATRGPAGYRYPWGDDLDQAQLSIEYQDYSVDTESVMGYYSFSEDVYFIHSFGAYADQPSPFGLTGLARPGREWNAGGGAVNHEFIMRSLSDLGGMAMMIPGLRPNTWGQYGWHKSKKQRAYSGPALAAWVAAGAGPFTRAGLRLVLRETAG